MSLSDEERRADKKRTLTHMMRDVGDHRTWEVRFEPNEPGLAETHTTTWRELLDDNLVDDKLSTHAGPRYRLTYHGWLRALMWSGEIDAPSTRERCTRLAQALKRVVKGRTSHYDEFASVSELSAVTDLPEGWLVNALDAGLLSVVFPDDKWDAHMDPKSRNVVRVSPTFGLNHLFGE